MPPGNYEFVAEFKGENSSWKGESICFKITPPFWITWWFKMCVALGIAGLIYLFFKYRILSYNQEIIREILRQLSKRLKRKNTFVRLRVQGKDIRIKSEDICIVKAAGNYLEVRTDTKNYLVRLKIGDFLDQVTDPLEYIRVSRSYIVRIDKIQEKGKKDLVVLGEQIPIGVTYMDSIKRIEL